MRITILLALIFTVAFSTATWAAPQGPAWEPCDYTTGWKTNSCG
jgi:hypothetical protein